MGTHPIFESDFDCLAELKAPPKPEMGSVDRFAMDDFNEKVKAYRDKQQQQYEEDTADLTKLKARFQTEKKKVETMKARLEIGADERVSDVLGRIAKQTDEEEVELLALQETNSGVQKRWELMADSLSLDIEFTPKAVKVTHQGATTLLSTNTSIQTMY